METGTGKLLIPRICFNQKVWSYIYLKVEELDNLDIMLLIPLYTGKYPPSLNLNDLTEKIIHVYYNKYPDEIYSTGVERVFEVELAWGRNFYKYLLTSCNPSVSDELRGKLLKLLDNSVKKEKQRRKRIKWKKKAR